VHIAHTFRSAAQNGFQSYLFEILGMIFIKGNQAYVISILVYMADFMSKVLFWGIQ
jgi:hypothetical protein